MDLGNPDLLSKLHGTRNRCARRQITSMFVPMIDIKVRTMRIVHDKPKLFITLDGNAATISRVRPEQTATKLDAPVNLDQLYTLTVLSAPYLSIRPSHQRYLHKQKQKTTTLSLGARPATPGTTLHYSKHATPTSPAHISMDAYLAFWASLSDAEPL